MIVPMKLVTLLCLEQDRSAAVDALAGLELMQLCRTAPPATKDVAAVSAQLAECERAIGVVRSAPAMKNPPVVPEVADDEIVSYASKLISGKVAAFKEQERLQHDLNLLLLRLGAQDACLVRCWDGLAGCLGILPSGDLREELGARKQVRLSGQALISGGQEAHDGLAFHVVTRGKHPIYELLYLLLRALARKERCGPRIRGQNVEGERKGNES